MPKLIFSLVCFLFSFLVSAQDSMTLKIDTYAKAYAKVYDFNGVMLVANKNKILYQQSFGIANREWVVMNTIDTRFPIASLTKQFTAVAILQLAERGKLSIDDKLQKYFPTFPKGDSITLHMLLNHTAGLKEFSQEPSLFAMWGNPESLSRDSVLQLIQQLPFNFSPGTFWGYSNTGYVVLGMIIEKVAGMTYEQYIQDNIFTKVGMKNSGVFKKDAVIFQKAYGYSNITGKLLAQDGMPFNISDSYGGLYSTAEDLLLWNIALYEGTILGKNYLEKMLTPNRADRGAGLGIFIDYFFDKKVAFHTGNIPGYSSIMLHYLEEDIDIILLTNRETNLDFLPKALAALVFNKNVLTPYQHNAVVLQQQQLQKFVAKFETPFPFEVVQRGNQLFMSFGLEVELLPESPTKLFFRDREVDIQLEYVFDNKDKISIVYFIEAGIKSEAIQQINK